MTYHGSKFDKNFLEAFLMYVSPYPKGTSVLLSNGLEGIVKENNKGMLIDRPIVILVPPINVEEEKIYQKCIDNESKANIGNFLSTLDKALYQKYFTEEDKILLEEYLKSGNQELYNQVFIKKDKEVLLKFYATCDRSILERVFISPKKSMIDLSRNINNNIVIDDSLILDEPEQKKNFSI